MRDLSGGLADLRIFGLRSTIARFSVFEIQVSLKGCLQSSPVLSQDLSLTAQSAPVQRVAGRARFESVSRHRLGAASIPARTLHDQRHAFEDHARPSHLRRE